MFTVHLRDCWEGINSSPGCQHVLTAFVWFYVSFSRGMDAEKMRIFFVGGMFSYLLSFSRGLHTCRRCVFASIPTVCKEFANSQKPTPIREPTGDGCLASLQGRCGPRRDLGELLGKWVSGTPPHLHTSKPPFPKPRFA